MFGYIRPYAPELKVKEDQLYKNLYCSLCRAQRKVTGRLSSLSLSYDFVFLYLLRSELVKEETVFEEKRAVCARGKRTAVAKMNDTLVYCAASSALLLRYKLEDDLADEGFFKRLEARFLMPFAARWLKRAKKRAELPEEELIDLLSKLSDMEKAGGQPVEAYAERSGEILALIASYGIEDPLTAMAGERIGEAVGKWIYLVDAADDYEDDKKKKRFNPFLPDGYDEAALRSSLDNQANEADKMLSKVPVFDAGCRAILKNILYYGMYETATGVLSGRKKARKEHKK